MEIDLDFSCNICISPHFLKWALPLMSSAPLCDDLHRWTHGVRYMFTSVCFKKESV